MVKIKIAYEAVQSGAVKLYMEFLESALRYRVNRERMLISPELSAMEVQTNNGFNDVMRRNLNRYPFIKSVLKKLIVRKSTKSEFSDRTRWIDELRNARRDEVVLIPHVVQNDGGLLDEYYLAISELNFIWVLHDLHPYHFPEQWDPADVEVMKARYAMLGKAAKHIIVHNDFTKYDVIEKLNIPADMVSVVKLPAFLKDEAITSYSPRSIDILDIFGIEKPYALWASSSTSKHKNHDNLILAWDVLRNQGYHINLVCTGSLEPRSIEINKLIRRLGLTERVVFTGAVTNEELTSLLNNATLAVCPTLFEGGGPVPAAEAIMAGIPLAVSNIPQARQLFDNRDDFATFFDPMSPTDIADAIIGILDDYETYRERSVNVKKVYKSMRSWDVAAEQYWRIIESV